MKILSILNPQETTDLVTFTEEILNGKLHFLCSVWFGSKYVFYHSKYVFVKIEKSILRSESSLKTVGAIDEKKIFMIIGFYS